MTGLYLTLWKTGNRHPALIQRLLLQTFGGHRTRFLPFLDSIQTVSVKNEAHKGEYQKAADFLLEKAFDLDLLYEDQNPAFLVEQGQVEEGIARRFVKDIELWVKLCKENEFEPLQYELDI